MKNAKDEWLRQGNTIKSKLETEYEITHDNNDFVTVNELKNFIKNQGINITDKKFGDELSALNLKSDSIRIDGRVARCRFGIKSIS